RDGCWLCYTVDMTQAEKLLALHTKYAAENSCTLKATATRAVFGSGNPEADIVFIGEAPGKKEDETGIPFVGAAGKFLDEMLARASLKREDIYITNIVKYRPPENRDPTPEEIAACESWLHEEISTIKPAVIVSLGRYSLNHFIPDVKISEVHGTAFRRNIPGLGVCLLCSLSSCCCSL
ncbi:MAG: uracil-DNA glycosylase, partial [Patescibacteria group bacterium]